MSLIFQTHGADAIENLWEFHPKISSNHGISTPDSRHDLVVGSLVRLAKPIGQKIFLFVSPTHSIHETNGIFYLHEWYQSHGCYGQVRDFFRGKCSSSNYRKPRFQWFSTAAVLLSFWLFYAMCLPATEVSYPFVRWPSRFFFTKRTVFIGWNFHLNSDHFCFRYAFFVSEEKRSLFFWNCNIFCWWV